MIERRKILGLEFDRIESPEDYQTWIVANGWPDIASFESETFLNYPQLKKQWISINRCEGRATIYARSATGGVRQLLGEKRPALQRR